MQSQIKIKHLFDRLGFGFSPEEWASRKQWSQQQAINWLFDQSLQAPTPKELAEAPKGFKRTKDMDEAAIAMARKEERLLALKYNADWVIRMAYTENAVLRERLALFWHGHFACLTRLGGLAARQLQTIQEHALGNFRDLVKAIARDPSMIRFLNNQQNRKEQPNENFARELMELFTIGRGNYTEQDIKEAARAFTGWSSTMGGEFVFRRFQHDFDEKTFMGRTGNFDGDEIIDIILEQRQTAYFIAQKIYRYFVNAQPIPAQVQELADVFYNSDYDIAKMLRHLAESDWFYAPANVGTKIKSPIDLLCQAMRVLRVQVTDDWSLIKVQKALGQVLFNPPNVAGWPGHKNWIDNSTLLLRLSLGAMIFKAANIDIEVKEQAEENTPGRRFRGLEAEVDLTPLTQYLQQYSAEQRLEQLCELLLPADQPINQQLISNQTNPNDPEAFVKNAVIRIMSLPEYQLC